MKHRQYSTRMMALVITCGLLAAAMGNLAAQSKKKPSKPPPTPPYKVVPLGINPSDMNNRGQVVGRIDSSDWTAPYVACLLNPIDTSDDGSPDTWYVDADADGQNDLVISLGMLPGAAFSAATGINDREEIIGYCTWLEYCEVRGRNIMARTAGFIISPIIVDGETCWNITDEDGSNALMTQLGAWDETIYVDSRPESINNLGVVVGNELQMFEGSWNWGAFLWSDDAGMIDLGIGSAGGINDVGQVIGHLNWQAPTIINPVIDGFETCWFIDADGDGINDLAMPLNADTVLGINNAGQIVGSDKQGNAVLLTPVEGGYNCVRFGKLPRWKGGQATALNSSAIVVGSYRVGSTEDSFHAFRWCMETGIRNLTDLTDGAIWLGGAIAINDAGQIVCWIRENHRSTGCILVPQ